VWNKSKGKQGKKNDLEGRWMPREAAGNAESRMELYGGFHSICGKKSPCPRAQLPKEKKSSSFLMVCQPLTAIFVIVIPDQRPF